jgi:hypothetical protein
MNKNALLANGIRCKRVTLNSLWINSTMMPRNIQACIKIKNYRT